MHETREPGSAPEGGEEMDQRMSAEFRREYDEHVERARQYYAQHGVWPPDPLLDEVNDTRRRIMAEHGNDWRKVLAWYGKLDEQRRERESRQRGSHQDEPAM
jgi:hypothetical protein